MTAPSLQPVSSEAARRTCLAAGREGLAGPRPQAGFRAPLGRPRPPLRLLEGESDRESYRNDETAYLKAGLPLAVALPTSTAEVAAPVKLAAEQPTPHVPPA